jgi:DNA-binding CsgD family transcriptional regulator
MRDMLGAADEALDDYHAAFEVAQVVGDRIAQWRALLDIGFFYASRDYAAMGEYLRRALDVARGLDDPAILGQSLNRYGNWYLFAEQPRVALRYHGEALALFQAADDRPGLAATYDLLAVTNIMGEDKLAAVSYYQRAIALFRELGDLQGLSSALATVALRSASYFHMSTVLAEDGLAACIRDGEEALQIARRIGWRSGEAGALVYLALVHGPYGEYSRALERARAARSIAQEIEHRVWLGGAEMALGAIAFDLLDYAIAREHLERALVIAGDIGAFFARRVAGYLALTCVAQRDLARAAEALAPVLDDATPMETQGQRLDWLARAELALAAGEPGRALQIADRLVATAVHADERGAGCVPSLWRLRGEALLALGRADEAEQALLAADTGAARLDLLPTRWRIRLILGRLYQAQSRRKLAGRSFAEARAIVAALARQVPDEAARHTFERAVAALLPRPQAPTPRHTAKTDADGLTERERQVAVLIAQGKINREIAEALVLGERTVETHVGNILAKLGLSSRRQVVAWAAEKGLVRRPK